MTAAGKNVSVSLLLLVAYAISIPYAGFLLATAVYMVAHMAFLGVRRPVVLAAVTGGLLLTAYVAMEVLLKVSLPRGLLF